MLKYLGLCVESLGQSQDSLAQNARVANEKNKKQKIRRAGRPPCGTKDTLFMLKTRSIKTGLFVRGIFELFVHTSVILFVDFGNKIRKFES